MHPDRPVLGRSLSLVWSLAERRVGASVTASWRRRRRSHAASPARKTTVVHNYPRPRRGGGASSAARYDAAPAGRRSIVGGLTAIRGARELVAAIDRVGDAGARGS